ncbi:MAG TPA: hypothetical protein V6D22_10355 [Candidatus Obscuribacterales bacterium]
MKNSSAYAIQHNMLATTATLRVCPVKTRKLLTFVDAAAKFTAGVGTGGFVAWLAAWAVTATIDYVYAVAENVFGQQVPHGVFMAMFIWFWFVPFMASFTFGCLRKVLRGNGWWYVAPGMLVMLLGCGDFLIEGAFSDVLEISPWLVVALLSAYGGMIAGQLSAPKGLSK